MDDGRPTSIQDVETRAWLRWRGQAEFLQCMDDAGVVPCGQSVERVLGLKLAHRNMLDHPDRDAGALLGSLNGLPALYVQEFVL